MRPAPRILMGRRAARLPLTRKIISTTIVNTVSEIITEMLRVATGLPFDDLNKN